MQITGKINSFENEGTDVETQRQGVMKEMEEKQRALAKLADSFDERTKELAKVLDQVKAGIFTMKFCYFLLRLKISLPLTDCSVYELVYMYVWQVSRNVT